MGHVLLTLYLIAYPYEGLVIEEFKSVKECKAYIESGSGWLMARSYMGSNSSPDRLKGMLLSCSTRI